MLQSQLLGAEGSPNMQKISNNQIRAMYTSAAPPAGATEMDAGVHTAHH